MILGGDNENVKVSNILIVLLIVVVIAFVGYSVYHFKGKENVSDTVAEETLDIGGENTIMNVTGTVSDYNSSDSNTEMKELSIDDEDESDGERKEEGSSKKDEKEERIEIKSSTKELDKK